MAKVVVSVMCASVPWAEKINTKGVSGGLKK